MHEYIRNLKFGFFIGGIEHRVLPFHSALTCENPNCHATILLPSATGRLALLHQAWWSPLQFAGCRVAPGCNCTGKMDKVANVSVTAANDQPSAFGHLA